MVHTCMQVREMPSIQFIAARRCRALAKRAPPHDPASPGGGGNDAQAGTDEPLISRGDVSCGSIVPPLIPLLWAFPQHSAREVCVCVCACGMYTRGVWLGRHVHRNTA